MANRKDEKERLRAERLARQAEADKAERKRLWLGYAVAGVISLAVIVGIVAVIAGGGDGDGGDGAISDGDASSAGIDQRTGVTDDREPDTREGAELEALATADLEAAAREANCELREDLAEEGNTHIPPDADLPKYKTEPPTSGDHFPEPQADGAYSEPLDPRRYVHSLEHGRIVIQYSPDLAEEAQLELKGLFSEAPDGILLAPNPDLPYEVAASAWTHLIGCESYEGSATIDAIRNFRDRWLARGPEAVPL